MRRLAVAALLLFVAACSETPLPASAPLTAVSPPTTPTTAVPTTTTTSTTVAPATTTTAAARTDGPPSVDMVPAGDDIEDFIPLVEGYFAVRNWALEHPDQVTEDILATVIEPGSIEMRDTLAEIQDLLDQDAHYEGLTETFVLVDVHLALGSEDLPPSVVSIASTYQYGNTRLAGTSGQISTDTIRRAAWTVSFKHRATNEWLAFSTLREAPVHRP